ncbi:MAG TPA: ABC transporter permease [Acidimicrobiales bacterium]|jgi:ABC-2 type transport system permease protein
MSIAAPSTPTSGNFEGLADIKLVGRQVRFEQLSFWLNPFAAFFTIGFSTIFLVIMESTAGKSTTGTLDGIKLIQYYVPAFIAYGIMSACFSIQAMQMVNRREIGLLKRLRLSPAPTWILLNAIFISSMIVALIEVVLMVLVGRGYGVHGPANWLPFIVTVVVGMVSFTAMAMGVTTLVPNMDAAGPAVNIVFFILLAFSGLWFPIGNGSAVAKITNYFPVRRLIISIEYSFNHIPGTSPWQWSDLVVMAIWGAIGVFVALRRWQWSPRRLSG